MEELKVHKEYTKPEVEIIEFVFEEVADKSMGITDGWDTPDLP